jgi:hypothetical protein
VHARRLIVPPRGWLPGSVKKFTDTVGAEVLDVDVDRLRNDPDLPDAVRAALEEVQFHRQLGKLQ